MIFIVIGVLAFLLSMSLLFFPVAFLKASEVLNRIFVADRIALKYRFGIGICLVLISFLLFFTAYYMGRS